MQARNLPTIRRIRFMGDSLSDRGTLAKRKLFGLIPVSEIAQLVHRSPHGRFTNGFTWDDYFAAMLVNGFIKENSKETAGQIADDVIDHDLEEKQYQQEYTLDDDKSVTFDGKDFIKSFCEGGLTAHDYRHKFTPKPGQEFMRLMVSTLAAKRALLIESDRMEGLTAEDKAQTLIIEWSGGNDLLTVNARPDMQAVKDAIAARRKNIEALKVEGYCHFVLMNLPDLSLIPRYQKLSVEEQENARNCSLAFNQMLKAMCDEMCVELIDIETDFNKVYNNPETYHFDPVKKVIPYVESPDFKPDAEVMSSCGSMFWDDIHPSAALHATLAVMMLEQVRSKFDFKAPIPGKKEDARLMFEAFIRAYHKKYAADKDSWWFGSWSQSRLPEDFAGMHVEGDQDYLPLIAAIIKHAYSDGGKRSYKVMQAIGWVKSGQIDVENDVLRHAKTLADHDMTKNHQATGCSIQ